MAKESEEAQDKQPDNAGLQHKISEKESPADIDKAGQSEDQREMMNDVGGMEREVVEEVGSDKDKNRKEKNR